MTIRHFYLFAGYALWGYILVCIFGKVLSDRYHQHWLLRQKGRIRRLFADPPQALPRKQLLKLARQDILLHEICTCFASSGCQDHASMDLILRSRLERAWKETPLVRCLLLRNIICCGARSPEVRFFVEQCLHASALEQFWAAEAKKSFHSEKEKVA